MRPVKNIRENTKSGSAPVPLVKTETLIVRNVVGATRFWVHGCEPGRVSDGSRLALCQTLSTFSVQQTTYRIGNHVCILLGMVEREGYRFG